LDLISCRNRLIYLNREAQQRALDIFHFALRPHGLLFLGSSESVDEGSPLFRAREKKHRIFEQHPARKTGLPVPTGPSTVMRALEVQQRNPIGTILPVPTAAQPVFGQVDAQRPLTPFGADELHLRLIERPAAPSVVVNSDYDVVHLSERAGRFVRLVGGVPSLNLLRAVPQNLRVELRGALFRAADSGVVVEVPPVDVRVR
jgi:two-component system CheB/CheR fusion protein